MDYPPPDQLQDSIPSTSSPTLTLAPMGAVLPHVDPEPNLLADQASHLTLSAPSGATASGPHGAVPGKRSRDCSACSTFAATEEDQMRLTLADDDAAQRSPLPAPLISHEHSHGYARELATVRDAAAGNESRDEDGERRRMQPADTAALVPVAQDPWTTNALRLPPVDARKLTLVDLPNEVLLHMLGYLEVCDLLATSRVSESCVASW